MLYYNNVCWETDSSVTNVITMMVGSRIAALIMLYYNNGGWETDSSDNNVITMMVGRRIAALIMIQQWWLGDGKQR